MKMGGHSCLLEEPEIPDRFIAAGERRRQWELTMSVPWWLWALIIYCAPGVYCFVAFLRMKSVPLRLPDENEETRARPLWLRALLMPVVFVVLVLLWPIILWEEIRARHPE
jgi:hypothetical protein